MTKKELINTLKKLCLRDSIDIGSGENFETQYEPIREYIEVLKVKAKPESAASELLHYLFLDIMGANARSEINLEGDFIDFVITEKGVCNPVCLELKPFFKLDRKKNILIQSDFNYNPHQLQIQKYLRHRQVEYVILSNVHKAYIFNRSALIDFKPFKETTLYQIFEDYLVYENLWDTVRRYEDGMILYDLDNEFFRDLKKWYERLSIVDFKEHEFISKEEMIVLFLNKFIFIKTLEDYGLVMYHFIQDEYENYVKKWKTKGYGIVFRHFFKEIEDFFEMYYDTELFKSNFWNFIIEDENNIHKFQRVFELILGLDAWSQTFGKGLVHYNYRQIDEDIFGKAYETWIAENKKDEGIFYTPTTITEFMANQLVDTLFDKPVNELVAELNNPALDKEKIEKLVTEIQNIKIIDSTSGSGSFLIKALRAIYTKYLKIDEATKWADKFHTDDLFTIPENIIYVRDFRIGMNFDANQILVLISSIILNHIYAVDKDERAVDTAKTNIWKEAVKLNPRIYNYTRLDDTKMHILPNLEMNFITGDSLTDIDFEKQIEIIGTAFKEELRQLFEIRNRYLSNPYKPDVLQEISKIKRKTRNRLIEEQKISNHSLFFPLEFFFCYFAPDCSPLPAEKRGFDGIISNPPWEAIKPVKKEFANLKKYEMDILNFNDWFNDKLKNNNEFGVDWGKYMMFYSQYTEHLYNKYKHQSSGDPNYYKFFIERDFQLIKEKGYFCLLVPSGFQTDEGSDLLRKLLIYNNHLIELYSFENRGYLNGNEKSKVKLFPDVDNRYKFSIVFARKENLNGEKHTFKAKFYLHDPKDLYNGNSINYDIEKIKQFSPENWSIMEFRSENDYEQCLNIVGKNKFLNELSFVLRREFDMTNDSNLFHNYRDIKTKKTETFFRLFEGKMIHQFSSSFALPRYLIKEEDAREELLRKVKYRIKNDNNLSKEDAENLIIPDDLLLDYQTYRLVYRAVGSSTNERTLISTIVPKNVFIGHSMNHIVNINYQIEGNKIISNKIDYGELVFLMSLFNSLTLNYYIRNKISANLTMNFIYELPIADANNEDRKRIIELGFSLMYRKSNKKDFNELKDELAVEIDNKRELEEIRAELEIIIAKSLYNLSKENWEYITSTFIFGGDSDTKKELDEIIKISNERWDI